jgi:hypothetical protein
MFRAESMHTALNATLGMVIEATYMAGVTVE